MNALQGMDRDLKEVIQVSTWKHDIKAQYLYDNFGVTKGVESRRGVKFGQICVT